MSNKNSSCRINLSFKHSSPEQMAAYEILNKVENKTEYVAQLVLTATGTEVPRKAEPLTREDLRAILTELLPGMLERGTVQTAQPRNLLANSGKVEPDQEVRETDCGEDHSGNENDPGTCGADSTRNATESRGTDVYGVADTSKGGEAALDIDVPDDFLDGLADMFGL